MTSVNETKAYSRDLCTPNLMQLELGSGLELTKTKTGCLSTFQAPPKAGQPGALQSLKVWEGRATLALREQCLMIVRLQGEPYPDSSHLQNSVLILPEQQLLWYLGVTSQPPSLLLAISVQDGRGRKVPRSLMRLRHCRDAACGGSLGSRQRPHMAQAPPQAQFPLA